MTSKEDNYSRLVISKDDKMVNVVNNFPIVWPATPWPPPTTLLLIISHPCTNALLSPKTLPGCCMAHK